MSAQIVKPKSTAMISKSAFEIVFFKEIKPCVNVLIVNSIRKKPKNIIWILLRIDYSGLSKHVQSKVVVYVSY